MSKEKLIDLISKLLAKANGTTVQAEADAFMAKANELLLRHNLSMSEVEMNSGENAITQDKRARDFGDVASEGKWESLLMSTIASHNFCQCITHSMSYSKTGTMSVIGSAQNIEITLYMFDVARTLIREISKKSYSAYRKQIVESYDKDNYSTRDFEKELQRRGLLAYRTVWLRSYLKGAVSGLNIKLRTEKKATVAANADKYAIILSHNKEALAAFTNQAYSDLRSSRSGSASNTHGAYSRGKSDGQGLSLNQGVSSAKSNNTKRLN